MSRMVLSLTSIEHNQAGFEQLIDIQEKTKNCFFDEIDIDMNQIDWFDADMCAIFGALLYRISSQVNTINFIHLKESVSRILSKNGFLSHYGHERIPDRYSTTIAYKRFDVKDDHYFSDYIETELITRSEIPAMSSGLLKKFKQSIFEIFSNAVLHSATEDES